MADREMRALQRDLAADPAARRRYETELCRRGRHSWSRYKGGDRVCRGCGRSTPARPREVGNMTLYATLEQMEQEAHWTEL